MTISANKRKLCRINSKTIKKSNIRKLDTPEERLTRSAKVVKKLPVWKGDTASIIQHHSVRIVCGVPPIAPRTVQAVVKTETWEQ
jgi:hypothetical protein